MQWLLQDSVKLPTTTVIHVHTHTHTQRQSHLYYHSACCTTRSHNRITEVILVCFDMFWYINLPVNYRLISCIHKGQCLELVP